MSEPVSQTVSQTVSQSASQQDLSQALVSILGQLQQAIQGAAVMVGEEIPLLVQEIMFYKKWAYVLEIAIFCATLITAVILFKRVLSNKKSDFEETTKFLFLVFWGGLGVYSFIDVIVTIFILLKITLAPKLWLLEYAVPLIKKGF